MPKTHPLVTGGVDLGVLKKFTYMQIICLGIMWWVKGSPAAMLFPILIARLRPVRIVAGKAGWFSRMSSTCSTSRSSPTPATSRRKRQASSLYYHSVSKYISRDGGGTGAARDRGVEEMRSLFVARVSP